MTTSLLLEARILWGKEMEPQPFDHATPQGTSSPCFGFVRLVCAVVQRQGAEALVTLGFTHPRRSPQARVAEGFTAHVDSLAGYSVKFVATAP